MIDLNTIYNKNFNSRVFLPTYFDCDICGNNKALYRGRGKGYKCDKCFDQEEEQREKNEFENDLKRKEKTTTRINTAKKFLSQKGLEADYQEAFKTIEHMKYKKGYFQSSDEVLTALELIRGKIKFEHQFYLAGHKIDFVLPDLKVLLEVDGIFHNRVKDKKRDGLIFRYIKDDWNIVRFKGEDIKENLKMLVPSIKRAVKRKQEYNKLNKEIEKSFPLPKISRIKVSNL